MPALARLLDGPIGRNRDLSQETVRAGGRKGEDVGRVVLAKELTVKPLQFGIIHNQANEAAAARDPLFQAPGKAVQVPPGDTGREPLEDERTVRFGHRVRVRRWE